MLFRHWIYHDNTFKSTRISYNFLVPWRLVHPHLVLVTVRPTRLVQVTVGLVNFSTHIFLGSVMFSPRIVGPPSGIGGLIVTCDNWSNPLWQLVHTPCVVKLGWNVTTSLGVWTFGPSDNWTCTFPSFLGPFPVFFVLCSAKSYCCCCYLFYIYLFFNASVGTFPCPFLGCFSGDVSYFRSCVLSVFSDILHGNSLQTRTRLPLLVQGILFIYGTIHVRLPPPTGCLQLPGTSYIWKQDPRL
jgi:hypothetical protein